MQSLKSFSSIQLCNPLLQFPGISVQKEIKDTPRAVTQYHYCMSNPKTRNEPSLAGLSRGTIEMLGLNYQDVVQDKSTAQYLSGSKLIPESIPLAHNYCGYQFGQWARQLGDGRAHTLGNIQNNNKSYELQLKGSGKTPFSRHADGNSVVSSAVRQFLASQLMHGLKIPTTRAASLVIADESVVRDPFYNGKIKMEKATIVLRVCQSFLRFGSLQVCLPTGNMFSKTSQKNRKILQGPCDYLIQNFYKDINPQQQDPYEQIFKKIVKQTSKLVAQWQSIGFVHGVLNTDNLSLINVTIDYGPFAFIDYFSKDFVSNTTDQHQRYSYRRQPHVVKWNLNKLAEAMDPLIPYSCTSKFLEENYWKFYDQQYYGLICGKLALQSNSKNHALVDQLFNNMHVCGTHFTNFFRTIQELHRSGSSNVDEYVNKIVEQSCPKQYYLSNMKIFQHMGSVDIKKILESDDNFNTFLITQQKDRSSLASTIISQTSEERATRQKQLWSSWVTKYISQRSLSQEINNPKYILLNDIARSITQELKNIKNSNEQIELMNKILQVLSNPTSKNQWFQQKYWSNKPKPVKLTCSS